ncbi:MAG: SRPBCC domain-containing protein [Melioribacteraceae bacterium]
MDYKKSIVVKSTVELVFRALTKEIDKWWSSAENSAAKEGLVFKVSFGEESYWNFKVLELKKSEKIIWKCVESHQDHNLVGMDEEWLNSKLYWRISEIDGKVKVDFLHEGLVSTGVCYDVCSSAWDFYIMESLKNYLETGKGKPNQN